MSRAFKRFVSTIPKIYKPEFNPVVKALVEALAEADDDVAEQISNAKDQLFVRTATGDGLVTLGNSLGVSKPRAIGLSDEKFQELIPNLSLKPKQIKKSFYDTADVFWGPLFSRANITTNNNADYSVQIGDVLSIIIDNGPIQTIKVLSTDLAVNGTATAEELITILSRIKGATPSILEDSATSSFRVNLRTDTPGSVGSIEILDSTLIGPSKVDFELGVHDILELEQRVSVYNFLPNELIIEIPSIVPALRRTLKGSHHFHEDSTIEPPQPPDNGVWAGGFFFNPSGSGANFTITGQKAETQQSLSKGEVYTSLTVDDSTQILEPSGYFVLNYGLENEEGPIRYRGVPNSNTVLIDPAYVFENNHDAGEYFNVVSDLKPYVPRRDGSDLAIYFTSPSGAREVVQEILETLKAAGIVIKFIILAPRYRYILDNPYLTSDDPPSGN